MEKKTETTVSSRVSLECQRHMEREGVLEVVSL